jgi:Protein of unknown function (DUF3667)
MSSAPALHAKTLHCRNCSALAPGKFCPDCGQDTAPHPPSAAEFVHEFIGHYVAFEGKLWKTLGLLFFKPGKLTAEYLAGRKQRYVLPLRLYLTISLIFFIVLGLVAQIDIKDSAKQEQVKVEMSKSDIALLEFNGKAMAKIDKNGVVSCELPEWVCQRLKPKLEKLRLQPGAELASAAKRFQHDWPYVMFVLMPLFALFFKLVYWRRGMVYGEHLVFAVHTHAAWFAFAFLTFLGDTFVFLALVVIPVYTLLAMRRVYPAAWLSTLLRAATVFMFYTMAITFAVGLLFSFELLF